MPGIATPARRLAGRLLGRSGPALDPSEPLAPLRATLFTGEQMRAHGRLLAKRHVLAAVAARDRLLGRLAANEAVVIEVGRMLAAALAAGRTITPAAEWLLDNLYLIEQEITTARRHLPRGYSKELPRLADDVALYGVGAGQPRIYDLALNAVAHGDGQLAVDTLAGFLAAYQEQQPLRLGELWAFPIMLRLALIENLRRCAVAVAHGQRQRDLAEQWAAQMLEAADERPSELILVVADLARSKVELSNAFVADLARRLQGRGAALAMPLSWLEQRLSGQSQTIEGMFRIDSRTQAEWQLTVANSIGSLRLVGATDWPVFVEAASSVETVLRGDPAGVYARMDFASRDDYRHAVERLAKRSGQNENDIARNVVAACTAAIERAPRHAGAPPPQEVPEGHVGHLLVGNGRPALARALGLRSGLGPGASLRLYLASVAALTVLLAAAPAWLAYAVATGPSSSTPLPPFGAWPAWIWALYAPALVIAASQLALAFVNWAVTQLVTPRLLPRLDFQFGIDESAPTMVAVPTLLTSPDGVDALADALEVHHLANRDAMLRFALVTDLRDAAQEQLPGDAALVEQAASRIAALNARYAKPGTGGDLFFLLHRPRRWNERERRWMGHERKRGKLHDLNALLRGHASAGPGQAFSRIEGDVSTLSSMRYVITLDSDTEMPQGSAAQMVASMAHPLQRPHACDPARPGVVTQGHAILQPRSAANLPSTLLSRHARLFGADAGIDPYTQAVSDVYQDLFDEGSYVGKGIYDIDAFEAALRGRLPDNRVLSHDLIEGAHARAGLLSDVTLFEQAPARHAAEAARVHRWTRGDWQLLPWLSPRVRVLPGRPPNPLRALSRWKLLDNLRRSLVPPSLVVLLFFGWLLAPLALAGASTVAVVCVIGLVPLLALATARLRRALMGPRGAEQPAVPWAAPSLRLLQQVSLLPDEARLMVDAVVRTLWRVAVARRRLLEWTASAELPRGALPGTLTALRDAVFTVPAGPLFGIGGAFLVGWLRPDAAVVAAPVLMAWTFAPLLVWWLDQPAPQPEVALSAADRTWLRGIARRTWSFFEDHVVAGDNFLPPDNMQEEPTARVAHRTSPTNIGFALLTPLTARDLGHAALSRVLGRIDATLSTIERLELHRGHLYNWYDTVTLQPLSPRYVSTVDSGNFWGCLLVLRSGLAELADEPPIDGRWWDGLDDALTLLRQAAAAPETESDNGVRRSADALAQRLEALRAAPPVRPADIHAALEALQIAAADVLAASPRGEALHWAQALSAQCAAAVEDLSAYVPARLLRNSGGTDDAPAQAVLPTLRELAALPDATDAARQAMEQLSTLSARALSFSEGEVGFLYDETRRLLAIGWHVDERRRDAGNYDLLASEARLGVYVAIAQGRLPAQAWFALGRGVSAVNGRPVLLSWSGSMFEYLMPALVMPQVPGTLLEQSCRSAVLRQADHGAERGVPWGVSESGYNAFDSALNYQYRAFGVPGLGLKRGLGDDLVIAPYATAMSLIVEPARASANLRRLDELGARGLYGFHEAVDFTPGRLPPGQNHAVVRSYMAHHQGMALLALGQVLVGPKMQARFEADAGLRAALPLLHEKALTGRIPPVGSADRAMLRVPEADSDDSGERRFGTAATAHPEVQLLSNGRYHVVLTQAGGGSSRWQELALTRWREDTTRDAWGSFCYLRDLDSGEFWSNTHQPTGVVPRRMETVFSESRAEFTRVDHGIETRTTIAVSPEDDIELRRVRLRNVSRNRRRIELTSYAEIVLTSASADAQHPAFNKLFIQTELLPRQGALLARRRPRVAGEATPWMFFLLSAHGLDPKTSWLLEVSHETDRARFIGRGRNLSAPLALEQPGPLSNTAGAVLDPVAASRCVLSIEPERSRIVDLVTGVAPSREACIALIDKYRDRRLADRVFELAWTHAQVLLRQLSVSAGDAQAFAQAAGPLVFAQNTYRADDALIRQNRRGQPGLWGYSISGDLPIVLVTISDSRRIELVRQLVLAHAWWRQKGLAVDLVIWNEEHDTYRQRLHEQILGLVSAGREANAIDRPGGIFIRHADQIAPEDRVLLMSVARVVFADQHGLLAEQLQRRRGHERRRAGQSVATATAPLPTVARRGQTERRRTALVPVGNQRSDPAEPLPWSGPPLLLANGFGGFGGLAASAVDAADDADAAAAREYVVAPPPGTPTPAPWCNVLANPRLGCVVSESGSAYTWFGNAHEFRLTPWHNDPISDDSGEAVYIRDEDSGDFWSASALPAAAAPVRTRHGFGTSLFEQHAHGIASALTLFVAIDAPVRFAVLKLTNRGRDTRRLSATGYVEWVLGSQRATQAPHIVTELAPDTGALLARNVFGQDNAARVAFFDVDAERRPGASITCHRADFIGRNGSMRAPQTLLETRLSGRIGPALDPCAAIQVPLVLAPGESTDIVFRLGAGDDAAEAHALIDRFRAPGAVQTALQQVHAHWGGLLGTVQVRTPDPALNQLANGWLLYQVVACRLWARSGYYQSGGAYGFRDQLQDAMAVVHTRPDLLREQLVRAASRQFVEGDVQHWWHPPGGRGVRTTCSDDYLFLPLALSRYWHASGDSGLFSERVPFIEGRPVPHGDEAYFDMPHASSQIGTVYEHARRAVEHGLRMGPHGLPLMGSGDWNDGMNRVGHEGRGESVWLAFFLCRVLADFSPLARAHGDADFALRCDSERTQLAARIEEHAWDGQWYRRAWFDDGSPLGSKDSPECRIDLIAQSWSVLSGAAPVERSALALRSMQAQLVDDEHRLVRLLDPPFDGAGPDPGYIAGYVPGVRENGGQYTHGAVWAAMALAESGAVEDAWKLLNMINPLNHARTAQEAALYKVEPYVVAADVYGVPPHTGRGGWTWYTGSAGWVYRLIVETLLGIVLENDGVRAYLVLSPKLPAAWPGFEYTYRRGSTVWEVAVTRGPAARLTVDGNVFSGSRVLLSEDGGVHRVALVVA